MINLYNLRLSFFLTIILFVSGCQLDQSVSLIKEKLFSDNDESYTEENEKVDEENKKELLLEQTESRRSIAKETKDKGNVENIPLETKPETKKKRKQINSLSFKEMGKARDNESKIVSFFSKIFNADDNKDTSKVNALGDKNIYEKKELDLQKDEILGERTVNDDSKKVINLKKPIVKQDQIIQKKDLQISDKTETNFLMEEQKNTNGEELSNNLRNKENKFDEKTSTDTKSDLAFFQLKPPKVKKKKIKETDKVVGLLLPLTGNKSSAGKIVINSLRYSMLLKPNQLNFKIFDTKGSPEGAVTASKEGVETGVKTFIGPIFSDETKEVKDYFRNKKDLTFFSLSPDLSNVSENVIVSGQNPEDQMSCIIQHVTTTDPKKILLIHHSDRYGFVIKKSFQKFLESFGLANSISAEYFEVGSNTVLNEGIKKLSEFDFRKKQLKKEIKNLKQNKILDQESKNRQLKSLERKLTLDSPFNHIIVASEGERLLEILSHLAFYDINSENTNIYGTSLWEDTDKNDNVFKNTYFVTSLRERNEEFYRSFKSVFSKDPMSFNYHIHDLISFVQNFKLLDEEEKFRETFYGEFSTTKINSGLLKRKIFLKKVVKNELTEEVFSCNLDAL